MPVRLLQARIVLALCWICVGQAGSAQPAIKPTIYCPALTRDLVAKHAQKNTILISVSDLNMVEFFGASFVENLRAAGISWYLLTALDPKTSAYLAGELSAQCFNAPPASIRYKPQGTYTWGGDQWVKATWNKVHVVKAVYDLGFHVVHSDLDVTWFRNPLSFFHRFPDKALLISTDAVHSQNSVGVEALENMTTPYISMNSGMYMLWHNPGGQLLLKEWLTQDVGDPGIHDQEGLNRRVRGVALDPRWKYPAPVVKKDTPATYFVVDEKVAISFLPTSLFAHQYSLLVERMDRFFNITPYAIHWVWGSPTREAKRQCMRDMHKYTDPPTYYDEQRLVTWDITYPQMPDDFNARDDARGKEMEDFHIVATSMQLQQLYWALSVAMALNRTLVLQQFRCYCVKNWFQVFHCTNSGEDYTQFPITCSVNQILRTKRVVKGLQVGQRRVSMKEFSFMDNPKVPAHVRNNRYVITPDTSKDFVGGTMAKCSGSNCTVPAHLMDDELVSVLSSPTLRDARILHFTNATLTFKGFKSAKEQADFDHQVKSLATYWCCRDPEDMKRLKIPDRTWFEILPPGHDAPNVKQPIPRPEFA